MNPPESQFDRNLERLIRSSFGPETRLTPSAREQLRQRLSTAWREKRRPKEFPAGILALFSSLILLLAGADFLSLANTSLRWPESFTLNPVGLLVLVNLVCLPIASLVIILRRKSWPSA
jgi:uncharacterized BrkB/YihY/UPF0761 family membrane protein